MMLLMTPILDDIRKAIDTSDKKRAQISRETGISQSRLCQLMAGTKGMSIEALEVLADCLGLKIVTERKRCTKGK